MLNLIKLLRNKLCFLILLGINFSVYAGLADLSHLQQAYPEYIKSISKDYIVWADDTYMDATDGKINKTPQEKLDSPSLNDQIEDVCYEPGIPRTFKTYQPKNDPGRVRYEPFFRKMYGNSEEEVKSHLVTIYWMPKLFGSKYPLLVTTVNHVNQKLQKISQELEKLVDKHPEYIPFLKNPGGTFKWRLIANTNRLSNHSFGMTIDINADKSNYWQWDLRDKGEPVTETTPLTYHNNIPWEIIPIFEKYGFIWGGKWYHYDTMHFEYRPELMISC
ncbi:M15 family metallopeptidase [Legionella sp. CNM-1927-20]|uniref:M15 family metallopeptidase n=1 Tax=Legionella sp. CNM-1927-20 TaxID=3422221 RepID=UPI00403AB4B4